MDQPEKGATRFLGNGGLSGRWILVPLLLALALPLAWPAYRSCLLAAARLLAHGAARNGPGSKPSREDGPSAGGLAVAARSMEFRIQQYRIDPGLLRAWREEWKCGPAEKLLLTRLLLRQLPESAARESSPLQRRDLLQAILELTAEGRATQPEMGFYWLAEALALFYSGQEAPALAALRQAGRCPRLDAGLKDLNQAETALWQSDRKPWMILPPTPRAWGLRLERPLHTFSRSLALQQRALLQKYNIERAVDLGVIHLGLALQIAEMAWTPADLAIARSIATRAVEPFWTTKGVEPTPVQLEKNFVRSLEDQGDRLSASKVRHWFAMLAEQEAARTRSLPQWRDVQRLAGWNASTVLAGFLLQIASLTLVVGTVFFFSRQSPHEFAAEKNGAHPSGSCRKGLAALAFCAGPILATITGQSPGGTFFIVSLLGGWGSWWLVMTLRAPRLSLAAIRGSLAHSLLILTVAFVLTTTAMALVVQQREDRLRAIAERGWLH